MVDDHGFARLREVTHPSQGNVGPARELGDAGAALRRHTPVLQTVDRHHRAADPAQDPLGLLIGVRGGRCLVVQNHRFRTGAHRPVDAVLELLGRVRFAEQLPEEELGIAPPVAEPVVPVDLLPPLVGLPMDLEVLVLAILDRRRDERPPRCDRDDPEDPVGMFCRSEKRAPPGGAEADQDCLVDPDGVHDSDGVCVELGVAVGLEGARPVRAPVSTGIDRHDCVLPRKIRHLRLPDP
jgi:hypothetical protein